MCSDSLYQKKLTYCINNTSLKATFDVPIILKQPCMFLQQYVAAAFPSSYGIYVDEGTLRIINVSVVVYKNAFKSPGNFKP